MFLSTEQTRAALYGIDNQVSWRPVERPVGPQPLPAWLKGAEVNWHEGYSNSPSVRLIVEGDVRNWDAKRFRKEGKFYRAYHEDGRLEQYAHSGAISPTELSRFRSADGTLREYRRSGPEFAECGDKGIGQMSVDGRFVDYGYEPGEWVKVVLPATTAQEGFGGAHVPLVMEDGSELILRGPWHVGSPTGYTEVSYRMGGERWGARAGLFVTLDLFTRVMARFQAHLELLEVAYGGATTIEPMKPEWDAPKRVIYDRELQARRARSKAKEG